MAKKKTEQAPEATAETEVNETTPDFKAGDRFKFTNGDTGIIQGEKAFKVQYEHIGHGRRTPAEMSRKEFITLLESGLIQLDNA